MSTDEPPVRPTAEQGLMRVTLSLTSRSQAALARLRADGSTQADAVNRAVQQAAVLQDYADPETGRITLLGRDGEVVHIHLVG